MSRLTPDITDARIPRHGVLELTFADSTHGEVEVLERMSGPVFERARTPEGFAEVEIDRETGTVVWPGDADLAPDTLYERIQTGAWPTTLLCRAPRASLTAPGPRPSTLSRARTPSPVAT